MKNKILISGLILGSILITSGSWAQLHSESAPDSISDLEKGLLCKKIEKTYGDNMVETADMSKWLHCRVNGRFEKLIEGYSIFTKTYDGYLSCTADLASGTSHTPKVINLKCVEKVRRSKNS